ncbi:hypothetical protein BRC90_01035 [Halobacteriales archaeon QS_4_69_34]|nr:MAG: hypothetical protein BRC90_01035 [Halobacteriales archaeon QS_4_69_34]
MSSAELRRQLGTTGTLFAGAGAAGALAGVVLLALLAVGVQPERLLPIVAPLGAVTVGLLVAANVWALANRHSD